eukprot:1867305-Lingulodinium_polyedra.AAC.1
MARVLRGRRSPGPLLVLADADGGMGSRISASVGPFGAEEENAGGAAFHSFFIAHSLVAPATLLPSTP